MSNNHAATLKRMYDASCVMGYETLNKEKKALFNVFLPNFMEGLGLSFSPGSIYYVEETEICIRENPEDDLTVIGGIIKSIDAEGKKQLRHSWGITEYKGHKEIILEKQQYLRFEYKNHGEWSWQHVADAHTWY